VQGDEAMDVGTNVRTGALFARLTSTDRQFLKIEDEENL
jgi:hypothetical protein